MTTALALHLVGSLHRLAAQSDATASGLIKASCGRLIYFPSPAFCRQEMLYPQAPFGSYQRGAREIVPRAAWLSPSTPRRGCLAWDGVCVPCISPARRGVMGNNGWGEKFSHCSVAASDVMLCPHLNANIHSVRSTATAFCLKDSLGSCPVRSSPTSFSPLSFKLSRCACMYYRGWHAMGPVSPAEIETLKSSRKICQSAGSHRSIFVVSMVMNKHHL